jgi:sortase A
MKINKVLLIIGISFFIIGISIIFFTTYNNNKTFSFFKTISISDYTENKENINDTTSQTKSKKLLSELKQYNKNLLSVQKKELTSVDKTETPFIDLSLYKITNNCIASIEIPSIDLELPIYLGASESNMEKGAVHLNYTSAPIGGKNTNCVIGGHTGYYGKTFFDNITKLKENDIIYIKNYWGTLKYKIKTLKVVKNNDTSILFIEKNKDLITLFTCISNNQGGFDRFVVIAERNK